MTSKEDLYFLFFTEPNFPSIEPVMRRLGEASRFAPRLVVGFDFEEYAGQKKRFSPPAIFRPESLEMSSMIRRNRGFPDFPKSEISVFRSVFERPYFAELETICQELIAALEMFISERNPSWVVLPEDTDYIRGRLAARLFKRHGVSTIAVLPNYYNLIWQYPLVGERLCDYYLVLNNFSRERVIRSGVDASRVFSVGGAYFDQFSKLPRPASDDRLTVFAMQGKPWDPIILDDLISIFSLDRSHSLGIKPHPRGPVFNLPGGLPQNIFRIEAGDDWLGRATTVISQTSTTLYEAVAAGRKAISVNYTGLPSEIFLPPAVIPTVHNPDELKEELAGDYSIRSGSLDLLLPHYPNATHKVASLLESLISDS